MSTDRFHKGDRVYHRQLRMYGTYLGKHSWGEETSSDVQFDDDDSWPDGRPVTTGQLELAEPR